MASSYELGKIDGREEGRDERSPEIARTMKANGLSPNLIAQYTGLDPAVIAGL